MEMPQSTPASNLNNFLENKQQEILALAQECAKDVVEKENALMDFEIMASINSPISERQKLTEHSRKLRTDCWRQIQEQTGGDFNKSMDFLNDL
ncbi:hypothetical protein CMI37_29945 [Candidatus Pacearchaeota archaeon]|nr:hypothetical protein [Candidatus Pacearchaeota archaeon]